MFESLESLALLEPRTGTQTVERAVGLLRHIATYHHVGCRLSTLSEDCGLRKSTAHRILGCLIREGLVMQRPSDRRYVLGPMLFELGLSATPERLELQHHARIKLAELAKKTSSVAKLFFRSGDDFVCSVRLAETRMTARSLTVFPGSRRPLAYAAGGAAILLALPRKEAFQIVRRNLKTLPNYSDASPEGILQMIRRSFQEGIAVNEGNILPGVNAVGLALCHANGEPFGSISIAGPTDTITIDRVYEYHAMLQETAKSLWARTTTATPRLARTAELAAA